MICHRSPAHRIEVPVAVGVLDPGALASNDHRVAATKLQREDVRLVARDRPPHRRHPFAAGPRNDRSLAAHSEERLASGLAERRGRRGSVATIDQILEEWKQTGVEWVRFELPDMHGTSRSKTIPILHAAD